MYLMPEISAEPRLLHGFSGTSDGNLAFRWGEPEKVRSGRLRFLSGLDVRPEDCAAMSVEHGLRIARVGEGDRGRGITEAEEMISADALSTDRPGICLFLLVADCLPTVLWDPERGALALAHMSWMNTDKDFARAAVEHMRKEYDCRPKDIRVFVGPSIRRGSYVFPRETIKERGLDWGAGYLSDAGGGRIAVDLAGKNSSQLRDAGILPGNIAVDGCDTGEDARFFSHYRSRRTGEPEGRFAAVVGIRP